MKRKYGALRIVAVIITVIAWIVLVVGVIGSIAAGALGADLLGVGGGGATYAATVIIGGIILSVIYFVFLLAFAQLIYLLIDVERNTREAAYRLRTGTREQIEPME